MSVIKRKAASRAALWTAVPLALVAGGYVFNASIQRAVVAIEVSFNTRSEDGAHSGGSAWQTSRAVHVSSTLVQEVFRIRGQKKFTVINRDITPAGSWDEVSYEFATPYQVIVVADRGPDEFYVAGRTDANEDILEQWILRTHDGAHFFHVEPASNGIGVPAAPLPGSSGGIAGGGEYVPARARTISPDVARLEIYRGKAFNSVWDLTADPEQRFVLVLGGSPRNLYRVPIAPSATPELLYTPAEESFLHLARRMHCKQHYTEGRVYIVRGETNMLGTFLHLMLIDADNDGVFDSTQTLTDAEYGGQGYKGQVWLSDFTHY